MTDEAAPIPVDENPFAQFVTPDTSPTYGDASWGERFGATARAHFYKSGLLGSSIAAAQADPEARNELLMQGLSPEEQQLGRAQMAQGMADEAKALQPNENPVRVTPAQIAQIKNDIWPKADSLGGYSSDVLGALAGGAASPETFLLPEMGVAGPVARIAGRALPEAVAGFVGRSFGTGASMAAVQTVVNPAVQSQRMKGFLQPEFDLGEWALSPVEGFAGGVALHGAGEAIGAGVRSVAGRVRAGFRSGAEREFEHLYADPAFRPTDAPAPSPRPSLDEALQTAGRVAEYPTSEVEYAALKHVYEANPHMDLAAAEAKAAHLPQAKYSPTFHETIGDDVLDPEDITAANRAYAAAHAEPPLDVVKSGSDHATLEAEKPDGNSVQYQVNKAGDGQFTVTRAEADPYGDPVEWRTGTLDENGTAIEPHVQDGVPTPEPGIYPTKEDAIAAAQRFEGHDPDAATAKLIEIENVLNDLALPDATGAPNVPKEQIQTIVDEALAKKIPSKIDLAKIEELVDAAGHPDLVGIADIIAAAKGKKGQVGKTIFKQIGDELKAPGTVKAKSPDLKLVKSEGPETAKFFADLEEAAAHPSGSDLPMDQASRLKRAKEMGFETSKTFYHGTKKDFMAFDPTLGSGGETAIFVTDSAKIAESYIGGYFKEITPNIIPLYGKMENPLTIDWAKEYPGNPSYSNSRMVKALAKAKAGGHDVLVIKNINDIGGKQTQYAFLKPQNLRAKYGAAFDPAKAQYANMLYKKKPAGSAGGPSGLVTNAAESPRDGIVKSLQQQGVDLGKTLGMPIRQGRLQGGKDTVGQFSKYGVTRVREVADFLTVAHEGGHSLEAQIGKPLSDLIDNHASELGPLDYDPVRLSPKEGFAEFFSSLLTNPAAALNKAPTFYSEFRQFMNGHNAELMQKLDAAAENFKAYLAAPSDVRIASQVVDGERHGWIKEAIKDIREDGVPHTIGMFFGSAYTRLVDRNYPVARTTRDLIRAIHEKTGDLVDVKPSENPAKLVQLFANARQGAVVQLRWGVIPYRSLEAAGPSMYDAINHASGGPRVLGLLNHETTSDLSTYMVAKRVSNLWDRHSNGDLENPPAAFSKADAEKAMADLTAKNPRLDEAAMMAHEFTRNMLAKQRDAGLIKQDLYDKLTQDPFYVPLFRDVKDKPMAGKPTGGGSDGPGSVDTVKKLRGSSRDIIDPIQGIMMQTLLAERTIRHNDIIRGLVGLAERAGEGGKGVVEPIPAKELYGTSFDLAEQIRGAARSRGMDPNDTELLMNSVANAFGTDDPILHTMFKMDLASKRGEPILFYKEAGEVRAARLTAEKEGQALYETLATLPPAATDIWSRVLSRSTKFLRLGVVAHPTFVLTNFIKDQIGVSILRPDYLPFLSGVKGIWTEASQGEASRLYAYLGGMSAGTATSGIREIEKNAISQITKRSYGAIHLTSFEGLHELTQITEGATRNSIFEKVYKQKLKQGLSPIDAGIEAAHQGTDVMDFGMHGSHTLAVRAFVPFLNPHVQGLNKAVRTMIIPLARLARGDILSAEDQAAAANAGWALGKMTALGGTLGALWAALNWEKESYRDATPDQKGQNLIIPIGNKTYRAPKPYELGLGFTAGEYAYAKFAQHDPRGARNLAEAAYEVLALPDLLSSNPLVKTWVETKSGVSMFTGRAIVPDTLTQRDPQYQYTAKTSGIARKVSDVSNLISDKLNAWTGSSTNPWSPMLVDNAIGNLAGGMGKELQIRSRVLLGDEDRPEDRFEDAAFVKRFTLDPARWSSTVQRYYEFAAQKTGDYARAANTYQFLYDTPRTRGDAADFLAGLSDDKKAYAILQIGGTEEGKGAFKPDDRRLNPIKRAQDAVSQVHSLSRELLDNTTTNTAEGTQITLTPGQRRDAQDALQSLGNMEMRNALVMIGDQGYQGRKLFNIQDQFNVLKAISPDVASELARRYATAKVYKADYIANAWPEVRTSLLSDGSAADLSDFASEAKGAGYEFDGERTKRRLRQRGAIAPSDAAVH